MVTLLPRKRVSAREQIEQTPGIAELEMAWRKANAGTLRPSAVKREGHAVFAGPPMPNDRSNIHTHILKPAYRATPKFAEIAEETLKRWQASNPPEPVLAFGFGEWPSEKSEKLSQQVVRKGGLKIRITPMPGYEFDEQLRRFVESKKAGIR